MSPVGVILASMDVREVNPLGLTTMGTSKSDHLPVEKGSARIAMLSLVLKVTPVMDEGASVWFMTALPTPDTPSPLGGTDPMSFEMGIVEKDDLLDTLTGSMVPVSNLLISFLLYQNLVADGLVISFRERITYDLRFIILTHRNLQS